MQSRERVKVSKDTIIRTASWIALCIVRLNQFASAGAGVRMPWASASSMSRLAVSFTTLRGGGDSEVGGSLCSGELAAFGTLWAESVVRGAFGGGGFTGPGLRPTLGFRC